MVCVEATVLNYFVTFWGYRPNIVLSYWGVCVFAVTRSWCVLRILTQSTTTDTTFYLWNEEKCLIGYMVEEMRISIAIGLTTAISIASISRYSVECLRGPQVLALDAV